ncbi:MAG: metal-dependent hydrolase [Chloroflexota bacterium]
MAQAGIHGLLSIAVRKWVPSKEWLILGFVLGNILPDMDALAVAYATLTGLDTHGLHRTFSHSLIVILGMSVMIYLISAVLKRPRLGNLAVGLGIGMAMHALLDLLIWFRGVEIFWPFFGEVNFWRGVTMPTWWYNKFESAIEFFLFALFFVVLAKLARKQGTDISFLKQLKIWTRVQIALFVIFLVVVFAWDRYFIIYGALYILSLGLAIGITIRMRKTIDGLNINTG